LLTKIVVQVNNMPPERDRATANGGHRRHGRGVIRACGDRNKSGIIRRKGSVQTDCKA
jgi:hypothetical protein